MCFLVLPSENLCYSAICKRVNLSQQKEAISQKVIEGKQDWAKDTDLHDSFIVSAVLFMWKGLIHVRLLMPLLFRTTKTPYLIKI